MWQRDRACTTILDPIASDILGEFESGGAHHGDPSAFDSFAGADASS